MSDPEFDVDGYPTEDTLTRIRSWPVETFDDMASAMDFAGRAWSYPDRWECIERWEDPDWPSRPQRVYRFSTGGWSGNESVIGAMQKNRFGWLVTWVESRRGGHYIFDAPEPGATVEGG